MLVLAIATASLFVAASTAPDRPEAQAPRAPACALREPVVALAGAGQEVVAVTKGGSVLLFDPQGAVRHRLMVGPAPGGRGHRRRSNGTRDSFAIAAGLLSDGDFNDPYDVDSEVEDPENLFLDGPAGTHHPGPVPEAAPTSWPIVAAAGRTAWIADGDGLARFDLAADVPTERHLASAGGSWRALAASADGRWLVGVSGGWLVRSADAGDTFAVVVPIDGPIGRLAVTDAGDVLAVGGGEVQVLASTLDRPRMSLRGTDVCASGQRAFTLGDGRLAVREGPIEIGRPAIDEAVDRKSLPSAAGDGARGAGGAAIPDDVDRLACAEDGARLAVYGARLWTSADGGSRWSARSDLPPGPIAAVAMTAGTLWVGTASGLWTLSRAAPAPPAANQRTSTAEQPLLEGGASSPIPATSRLPRRAPWWLEALPRLELGFAAAEAQARRDVRAFFLLTFALGEQGRGGLRRQRFALEALWQDQAVSARASALARPSSGEVDALEREERATLARILESTP